MTVIVTVNPYSGLGWEMILVIIVVSAAVPIIGIVLRKRAKNKEMNEVMSNLDNEFDDWQRREISGEGKKKEMYNSNDLSNGWDNKEINDGWDDKDSDDGWVDKDSDDGWDHEDSDDGWS